MDGVGVSVMACFINSCWVSMSHTPHAWGKAQFDHIVLYWFGFGFERNKRKQVEWKGKDTTASTSLSSPSIHSKAVFRLILVSFCLTDDYWTWRLCHSQRQQKRKSDGDWCVCLWKKWVVLTLVFFFLCVIVSSILHTHEWPVACEWWMVGLRVWLNVVWMNGKRGEFWGDGFVLLCFWVIE